MRPICILQHQDSAPPAMIGEFLRETSFTVEVRRLHDGDAVPDDPRAFAAIIVLDGTMDVGDDEAHPFLADERETIAAALEAEVPLLGVCLGAQQMATVAGGGVYRRGAPEIGWHPIEIDAYDPILFGYGPRYHVFEWREHSCVLPDDAVLIASRGGEPQIFRLGRRAWGLQFHPEVDKRVLNEWFARDPEVVDAAWSGGLKKLRQATKRELYRSAYLCGQLVGNFLNTSGARDGSGG
jgi:GMP synthase (glutamine-hydrolysing)